LISGSRHGLPDDARQQRMRGRPGAVAAGVRPLPWLAAVAGAFTLVQLVLVARGLGLGWDETVYVSQVSPQAPAAFFSAPRARGIAFLVAPVTELTTSTAALRVYLSLLSGCGLFVALWVWRRLLPTPVLAIAGALFASLWITMFYGPQVMPNLWVAYAALIAVGCFLRAARRPTLRMLVGLTTAVALASLMRPVDALWLALPLAVAAPLMRARRRPLLLLALTLGLAVGWAAWIIEAYLRYGGLLARLRRASDIQGHLGAYLSVDDHVRALGGNILCRPCDVPWPHPVTGLWFLALPLLVAGGVWAAARTRYRADTVLATGTGLTLAAPYLFTVGYAAPRFLLPTYALLSLPVAQCLVQVVQVWAPWRRAAVAVVAMAATAHLAVQLWVLDGAVDRVRANSLDYARVAAELRAQGVRPPCVLTGEEAIRIGFRIGCSSRQPNGNDTSITPAELAAMARHLPVVVLRFGDQPAPDYVRHWRFHPLPDLHRRPGYHAYLSPTTSPLAAHRGG
jgi:hypothetical protein